MPTILALLYLMYCDSKQTAWFQYVLKLLLSVKMLKPLSSIFFYKYDKPYIFVENIYVKP